MRKVLRLILLLAILPWTVPVALAQENGLMASFGGATFQMDDMKYLQEYILDSYPVEGKIISSFPLYSSASINFLKQMWPIIRIGIGYAHTSTGAKTDYSDYSGYIHTNMIAISHRLGAFFSYTIMNREKLDLSLYGRFDANISKIEVSTSIFASGLSSYMINKYRSVSPNVSAGLELMYNIKDFAVGIEGGYLVDFPGDLKDTDRNSKLYDPADSRRVLTSNWTGWRAGIKGIMWLGN